MYDNEEGKKTLLQKLQRTLFANKKKEHGGRNASVLLDKFKY